MSKMISSNRIDLRQYPERIPAALAREGRWDFYYELRGGQGVVYIVYDNKHAAPFAMKTYQQELFRRDPKTASRFEHEAYAWTQLDAHENVVRAHFVDQFDRPYLTLEYVMGGNLRQWLNQQRLSRSKRPLREALRMILQCCDGMLHAAALGVTPHRDLKPENCMLTENGTLKVTDFGMARVVAPGLKPQVWGAGVDSADHPIQLTTTGGTPLYMAPEQWESDHTDERTDIYALGVMLYEMLVGQHPFAARMHAGNAGVLEEGYWARLRRLHMSEEPPLEAIAEEALQFVVAKCMEKNAVRRWAGFTEVRAVLARVYESELGEPAPDAVKGRELHASEIGNKGLSLWSLGRNEEALPILDKAIELNPDSFQSWSNRGLVLTELKRYNEALTNLDKAIELNPGVAGTWNNRGRVFADLKRPAEAFSDYNRAIELDPHNPRAWNNKGLLLKDLMQPEEALTCYDEALRLMPEYANAWHNRGIVLGRLKRHEEALASFKQALTFKPEDALSWHNAGFELRNLGRFEEALACYDKVLTLEPDNGEVWFKRGVVLNDLQLYEESFASYDRAVVLKPDHVDAWFNRALVLSDLGRREEALASFDRVIAIKNDDADAWSQRGRVLLLLQRDDESIQSFRRAVEINPQLGQAWLFMGAVLCSYKQYEQAAVCLENALRLGEPKAADLLRECRRNAQTE